MLVQQQNIKLRYIFLFILLLPLVLQPAYAEGNHRFDGKFSINHKQTRMMQFENLKRVDIGNPEIINVSTEPGSNHFIIVGLSPGKTDVTFWGKGDRIKRYEIRVRGDERFAEKETLSFLMSQISGVAVGEIANEERFTISGKPNTVEAYEKVMEVTSKFDNVITNVRKPVFDEKPTVRMRVKFLEISSAALKRVGIDWNSLLTGIELGVRTEFTGSPFSGSGTGSSSINLGLSLTSAIKALIQDGNARVLKEQSILVESGGTGSTFTGGEFPIVTRGSDNGPTTDYKPFGMSLQVQPLVNGKDQIHSSLTFEMSDINDALGPNGNPVFKTTQHSTQITLEDKKAIILADFIEADDAKIVKKVPGLGHIPVFGELFKSREFQRRNTELYVLIEPEIIRKDTIMQANKFFGEKNQKALLSTQFNLLD